MRKGYWRTSLRRLRQKLAVGENVMACRHGLFVIASVCADDDAALDDGRPVRLAEDERGNWFEVDVVGVAHITFVDRGTGERIIVGDDLAVFIDALHSFATDEHALGAAIEGRLDSFGPVRRALDSER